MTVQRLEEDKKLMMDEITQLKDMLKREVLSRSVVYVVFL